MSAVVQLEQQEAKEVQGAMQQGRQLHQQGCVSLNGTHPVSLVKHLMRTGCNAASGMPYRVLRFGTCLIVIDTQRVHPVKSAVTHKCVFIPCRGAFILLPIALLPAASTHENTAVVCVSRPTAARHANCTCK